MLRLRQTIFGKGKGNCFATCIACLLEVPVEDVPNFCWEFCGLDWWDETQRWLGKRGYGAVEVLRGKNGLHLDVRGASMPCILTGKSPRGDFLHCTVGQTELNGAIKFVHDPHPDDTFFDGPVERVLFLVPLRPEVLKAA